MSNKTFNPEDFRRKKPKEPALPEIPETQPEKAPTLSAPSPSAGGGTRADAIEEHSHGAPTRGASVHEGTSGARKIRLMDTISLTDEPEWEKVLHGLGITNY